MTNKLESDFREIARKLYDLQVAYLFKVPEEYHQTPCDFFGHTINGRAILVECKQVNAPSLKVGGKPGLAPHQWIALRQAHRCGAISLVVWQRGSEVVVVPYSVCEVLAEGRRSIPWSDVFRDHSCSVLLNKVMEYLSDNP